MAFHIQIHCQHLTWSCSLAGLVIRLLLLSLWFSGRPHFHPRPPFTPRKSSTMFLLMVLLPILNNSFIFISIIFKLSPTRDEARRADQSSRPPPERFIENHIQSEYFWGFLPHSFVFFLRFMAVSRLSLCKWNWFATFCRPNKIRPRRLRKSSVAAVCWVWASLCSSMDCP